MKLPTPSYCVRYALASIFSISVALTQISANAQTLPRVRALPVKTFEPRDGYIDPIGPRYKFCPASLDPQSYDLPEKQIFEGETGWYFLQGDIYWNAEFSAGFYKDLARISTKLKQHGTQLVLLMPPPRAMLAYRHLPEWARINGMTRAFQIRAFLNVQANLRRTGAVVPDILAEAATNRVAFDQLTSPSDLHWTTTGAWVAALAIARTVSPQNFAKGIPAVKGTPSIKHEHAYTEILNKMCGTKYLGQYVRSFAVVSTQPVETDLLGETKKVEVVVVGTSFSALTDRYSFSTFLESMSGKSVLNLAITGGGPLTSIQQYTESSEFKAAKPKFIIWEFLLSNKPDGSSAAERAGLLRPACGPGYPAFKTNFKPGATPLATARDLARASDKGGPLQFELRSDNPAFKNFTVKLNYADGHQRSINVDTRRASAMNPDYTVVLPEDHALISDISVINTDPLTGSVSAQLCPASGELAGSAPSSQPSWYARLANWFKSLWG